MPNHKFTPEERAAYGREQRAKRLREAEERERREARQGGYSAPTKAPHLYRTNRQPPHFGTPLEGGNSAP